MNRQAFTLVETVISLAIVAILAGILLPAVNSVRESVRRINCQSNLRNLALANANFEAAHKRLPPGYLGSSNTQVHDLSARWIGNIVYVMPFIEQSSIYEVFSQRRNLNPRIRYTHPNDKPERFRNWWSDNDRDPTYAESCWETAHASISILLCPSDSPLQNSTQTISVIHTWSVGDTNNLSIDGFEMPVGSGLGRTNYLGVAGRGGSTASAKWQRWLGVFSNGSETKLSQITDGTSNTLLMGEVTGNWSNTSVPSGRLSSFVWTCPPLPTGWGLKDHFRSGYSHTDSRFNSLHQSIVNFCLVDGSCASLSVEIDDRVFQALGAFADGKVVVYP